MWSSSLAAVALAAALEASPAQNTERGYDYAGKAEERRGDVGCTLVKVT